MTNRIKLFLIKFIPIRSIRHGLRAQLNWKPALDITKDSKCLMVCPHPDDEIIGAGACMIEHYKNFDCICISSSGLAYKNITAQERSDIRIKEFHSVMDFIGIKKRWIFETFGIPHFIEQIKGHLQEYISVLDIKKYDYIFLPHPNDNHPEHRFITNILIKQIIRKTGYNKNTKIVFYEVWEPISNANYYYCFNSKTMNKKCAALDMYKSQNVWIKYADRMMGLNKYRGMLAGNKPFAEAYKIIPISKSWGTL